MTSTPRSEFINQEIDRVPADVVARASQFQPAILADVGGRRGTLHGRIKPLSPSMKLAGPALTVEVRPGDNLMIHTAMALAEPGDILVVDGKGDQTCALMGAIMVNACKELGLGGVVIDAAVRDSEELRDLDFPVFSVGTNPNGPTKFVPGRIGWQISAGGASINPGDLIVGDEDGVVVIARDRAAPLMDAAEAKVADETKRIEAIKKREALRPVWLDDALRAAGVLRADETLDSIGE